MTVLCSASVTLFYSLRAEASELPHGTADQEIERTLIEWEQSHLELQIAKRNVELRELKLATVYRQKSAYRLELQKELNQWRALYRAKKNLFRMANGRIEFKKITSKQKLIYLERKLTVRNSLAAIDKEHLEQLRSTFAKEVDLFEIKLANESKANKKELSAMDILPQVQRSLAASTEKPEYKNLNKVQIVFIRDDRSDGNTLSEKRFIHHLRSEIGPRAYQFREIFVVRHALDQGHAIRNQLLEWEDYKTPTLLISTVTTRNAVLDFLDQFPSYNSRARVSGWIEFLSDPNRLAKESYNRSQLLNRTIASNGVSLNPAREQQVFRAIKNMEDSLIPKLAIPNSFPVVVLQNQRTTAIDATQALQNRRVILYRSGQEELLLDYIAADLTNAQDF